MKIAKIDCDIPITIVFDDGLTLKVSESFPLCFFKEGMEFRDLQEFLEDVEALDEF